MAKFKVGDVVIRVKDTYSSTPYTSGEKPFVINSILHGNSVFDSSGYCHNFKNLELYKPEEHISLDDAMAVLKANGYVVSKPAEVSVYINIYRDNHGKIKVGTAGYPSRKRADSGSDHYNNRIGCQRVTFTEGVWDD